MMAADQLLKDILSTARVPKDIKDRARYVLRHWPDTYYINELARRSPDIITERMEPLHRMVAGYSEPVDNTKEDHI
jgi:hypothetical protein